MSLPDYLAEREQQSAQERGDAQRDVRQGDIRAWLVVEHKPEIRIASFDRWCRHELAKRLDWAWAGDQKAKRIEQARLALSKLAIGLWRRGFLLDGHRLADRMTGLMDAVGNAQRAGKVGDFWPYFNAAVDRFVGQNAEELREETLSAGMHVGQVFQALTRHAAKAPALPELLAQRASETLREKVNRHNRTEARKSAERAQLPLF